MRIAIVNHDLQIREILRRILASVPGYQMVWMAGSCAEAVQKCATERPDLILLDPVMPKMDGVQAISEIMKHSPCAILIVTASIDANRGLIFEAMGNGALDAVRTPLIDAAGQLTGSDELLKKINMICRLQGKNNQRSERPKPLNHFPAPPLPPPLVAIGSSTGGPKALAAILSALPSPLGVAIIIVQHVDEQFASGLTDWLGSQTRLTVKLAKEGTKPMMDTVLIAGTNDHLIIGSDLALHYTQEPRDNPYRPSVDAFFLSLDSHWPRKDIAVLLTGMGKDGAKGLLALRKAGWHTIAQDEKTSAVYGMPAAAAQLNAADDILALEEIAGNIKRRLQLLPS